MLRKALIVYGKEMRVMVRDRRMVIGMAVSALVIFPLLMGFIGNLERLTGDGDARVPVVAPAPDPVLRDVLEDNPLVRLTSLPDLAESEEPFLTIFREGNAYRIRAESTERTVWAAAESLRRDLETVRQRVIEQRMAERGVRMRDLRPFDVVLIDTSDRAAQAAAALSFLVPYLAVILLVTNAVRGLYIAVGEKERNTLASLLVSTVPRPSIVIGKSLAIMTFAVVASLLLIAGMVVFAKLGFSVGEIGDASGLTLSATQIAALAANLVALALLISSLIMIIGTFARTQREAGMYTAPIVFLSLFLAIFALSPATFGSPVYAVPILGNALAMKDTIQGSLDWTTLAIAVSTNLFVFAALTLASVRLYLRESVLFRA